MKLLITQVFCFLIIFSASSMMKITNAYNLNDSVAWLVPSPNELISRSDSITIRRNAIVNADSNPLFMEWAISAPGNRTVKGTQDNSIESKIKLLRKQVKEDIANENPELYSFTYDDLPIIADIKQQKVDKRQAYILGVDSISPIDFGKLRIIKVPPQHWKYGGKAQVQASQLYISENWYKGGEGNIAILSVCEAYANYDNKKNVQWENKVEWKLGAITSSQDTIHPMIINEDLFKVTSKIGLKAFTNWYYTANVELNTQLFNTFKANSYERVNGFLSPIRFTSSIGLDYKYKNMVSVFISPATYRLIYVNDTTNIKTYTGKNIAKIVGLDDGTKIKNEFGSLLKVNFKHSFSSSISLESILYFYTNYTGIEFDWEVIGNFTINRFLGARISLQPRYDSTVKATEDKPNKIQFKEFISFGFMYKF